MFSFTRSNVQLMPQPGMAETPSVPVAAVQHFETASREAAGLARTLQPLGEAQVLGLISRAMVAIVAQDALRHGRAQSAAAECAWHLAQLEELALDDTSPARAPA